MFLDIHRTLGFGGLRLGLILLLLFLGLPFVVLIGLALLALPILGALDGTLLGTFLAHHGVFSVGLVEGVVVFVVAGLCAICCVACLLLLARLFLLRFQTTADMLGRCLLKSGALAVLANDSFDQVFLARFAGWEYRDDLVVEGRERG